MAENLFETDPALMGAIVGGLLTTSGALAINAYQNYRENRNLKRALNQEIRRTNQILGPLAALHELYTEGSVDLDDYEGTEGFQWRNDSRKLNLEEAENNHPGYGLYASSLVQSDGMNSDQIYESNTDKIGRLSGLQAQSVIHFYSSFGVLMSTIGSSVQSANRVFISDRSDEYDDPDQEDYDEVWDNIKLGKELYEFRDTTMHLLSAGFLGRLLYRAIIMYRNRKR